MSGTSTPAGWYPDPSGAPGQRWWDGQQWGDQLQGGDTAPADPDLLWEGERTTMATAASGGKMVRARYRITRTMIHFEAGMLSSKAEQVPLWAVRDVDLQQSMTQKARGVGDVVVHLEHSDWTGRNRVVLESVRDPRQARDVLNGAAAEARRAVAEHHRTYYAPQGPQIIVQAPAAAAAPGPPPGPAPAPPEPTPGASVADELVKFAQLRDAGVLTDEEFAAQKARLLGG